MRLRLLCSRGLGAGLLRVRCRRLLGVLLRREVRGGRGRGVGSGRVSLSGCSGLRLREPVARAGLGLLWEPVTALRGGLVGRAGLGLLREPVSALRGRLVRCGGCGRRRLWEPVALLLRRCRRCGLLRVAGGRLLREAVTTLRRGRGVLRGPGRRRGRGLGRNRRAGLLLRGPLRGRRGGGGLERRGQRRDTVLRHGRRGPGGGGVLCVLCVGGCGCVGVGGRTGVRARVGRCVRGSGFGGVGAGVVRALRALRLGRIVRGSLGVGAVGRGLRGVRVPVLRGLRGGARHLVVPGGSGRGDHSEVTGVTGVTRATRVGAAGRGVRALLLGRRLGLLLALCGQLGELPLQRGRGEPHRRAALQIPVPRTRVRLRGRSGGRVRRVGRGRRRGRHRRGRGRGRGNRRNRRRRRGRCGRCGRGGLARAGRRVLRVPGRWGVVDGELARRLSGGLRVGVIIDGCVPAPADLVPIAVHNASWCGRAPSCRGGGRPFLSSDPPRSSPGTRTSRSWVLARVLVPA